MNWKARSVVLLLVAVLALSLTACSKKKEEVETLKKPVKKEKKIKKKAKKKYYCPLCGEEVEQVPKRRVLVVKVENSPAARPQTGLDEACLVYEFLTEGGITRFNAFYLCKDAEEVGPVRSARFPDLTLLKQYDALFAHCGGSVPVLQIIRRRSSGYYDLDQMIHDGPYWRVRSKRKPHNLYTSTLKLRELAQKLGYEGEKFSNPIFAFKKDRPLTTPTATSIDIPFSRWCDSKFVYDAQKNRYLRYIGSTPHKDAKSGEQLWAKNVIIIFTTMSWTNVRDARGTRSPDFKLTGEGEAWFFFDGNWVKGKWKAGASSPPTFFDSQGLAVQFNRGPIWIEVVPPSIRPVIK